MSKLASWKSLVPELAQNYQLTLCKVFPPTRNALDFKHASQWQRTHKYMEVHVDIYVL